MIKANFYPGPSRVFSSLPEYFYDAYMEGIVSINHRSEAFATMLQQLKKQLTSVLQIPEGYEIVFASSATECWEMIAQSVIQKSSIHIYNGAFGEKWLEYTRKIRPESTGISFEINELPLVENIKIPASAEVICFTQNETSNGTQLPNDTLQQFRAAHPEPLVAIDATSSMGGVALDFSAADIWFASVQKCFGLPAGLALMVLSHKAISRILKFNEKRRYNSLRFVLENYRKNQAPYTPNILNMYLLLRVLTKHKSIEVIDEKLRGRLGNWYQFLEETSFLTPLVTNKKVQSTTVIAMQGTPEIISEIKTRALAEGIVWGNGYGKWKENTIRIANFPAIKSKEIELGQRFLSQNFT